MVKSHAQCEVFSDLMQGQMNELAAFRQESEYERNQVIYFCGDPADSIYQIVQGRVKVVRVSPEGREKIIDIYQNGDYFGELCICGAGSRTDQAIALEPVQVRAFKIEGLLRLLTRKPELSLDLLQLVCKRLAEYQDQIATLSFDNVPMRLAREILRLSEAPGATRENGSVRLGVNLTHEEIASLIGTSREIVTTLMNQFRNKGFVDYDRRSIHVHDEKLRTFVFQTEG